jgi:hypothetical protein
MNQNLTAEIVEVAEKKEFDLETSKPRKISGFTA